MRCSLVFLLAIISLASQFHPGAIAQTVPSNPAQSDSDRTDARAYAVLFRRAVTYQRMAQAATSPDKPEAQLNKVLPNRLQLSGPDAASLQRIASAWSAEMMPVRAQIVATVKEFRKSLPNGSAGAGVDATPPAALGELQQNQDAITLRYRDLLRNAMRTEDFSRVHGQVRTLFGGGQLTGPSSMTTSGANAGVSQ